MRLVSTICTALSLTPILCNYFLFLSFNSHLHLPSFPTRRSSDLSRSKISSRTYSILSPRNQLASGPEKPCFVPAANSSPTYRDRKSTRLNSSHGSISYAVFCLKKKNKHGSQRPRITVEHRVKRSH